MPFKQPRPVTLRAPALRSPSRSIQHTCRAAHCRLVVRLEMMRGQLSDANEHSVIRGVQRPCAAYRCRALIELRVRNLNAGRRIGLDISRRTSGQGPRIARGLRSTVAARASEWKPDHSLALAATKTGFSAPSEN